MLRIWAQILSCYVSQFFLINYYEGLLEFSILLFIESMSERSGRHHNKRRRHHQYDQPLPAVQELSEGGGENTADVILDVPDGGNDDSLLHRRRRRHNQDSSSEEGQETGLASWQQNGTMPKTQVVKRLQRDNEPECDTFTDGCLCFMLLVLCFVLITAAVYIFYNHSHDVDHDATSVLHELGREASKAVATTET